MIKSLVILLSILNYISSLDDYLDLINEPLSTLRFKYNQNIFRIPLRKKFSFGLLNTNLGTEKQVYYDKHHNEGEEILKSLFKSVYSQRTKEEFMKKEFPFKQTFEDFYFEKNNLGYSMPRKAMNPYYNQEMFISELLRNEECELLLQIKKIEIMEDVELPYSIKHFYRNGTYDYGSLDAVCYQLCKIKLKNSCICIFEIENYDREYKLEDRAEYFNDTNFGLSILTSLDFGNFLFNV